MYLFYPNSVTHVNTRITINGGNPAALTSLQQPAKLPATNTQHSSKPRAGRMTLKKMSFCWCAVSFWCFASAQLAVAGLLRGFSPLPRVRPPVGMLPALRPVPALVARAFPLRRSVRPRLHGSELRQHDRPHLQLRLGLRRRGFYGWRRHRRRWQVWEGEREE